MHLAHTHHIHEGKKPLQFILRTGFFIGFTGRPFGGGFAHFHETRRQRPFAPARFDIAFAQQDLRAIFAPDRHGTHHVERVFVVDGVAGRADRPLLGVAIIRQAVNHGGTANAAVFQGRAVH